MFFSATLLIALVGGPLYIYFYGLSWLHVSLFLLMLIATLMSITGGYHRLYAHRTYESNRWLKVIYLLFGAAAFQESCLKWAWQHRLHHLYVDEDKDPYNIRRGFFWAHIGWILTRDNSELLYPSDLTDDPLVMWQHKYWLPIGTLVGFGLPALLGGFWGDVFGGLLFGGVIRLVVAHHLTFTINSLAHSIGSQPYSNQNTSKDSWITAFFTFGEGYHNYHHWYSRDYRNGIRFYHWDPAKWLIRFLSCFGQTWNLKMASEEVILKARLKMERFHAVKRPHSKMCERVDELFESLMKQVDELENKRKAWVLAKKKSIEKFDQNLKALKANFNEAKEQYKDSYRSWRLAISEISLSS